MSMLQAAWTARARLSFKRLSSACALKTWFEKCLAKTQCYLWHLSRFQDFKHSNLVYDLSGEKKVIIKLNMSRTCFFVDICGKLMNNHWSSPSGAWPLRCPLCGRGFSKQTALRSHMLMHAGEERKHRNILHSSHILMHAGELSSRSIVIMCNTQSQIC